MSDWRNRIVDHGEIATASLTANPDNWRAHPPKQLSALRGAIQEVGYLRSVTVNRATGHLIDGHARVLLAQEQGEPTVPVEYVELTEEEERLALLTLDPLSELAVADRAKLKELLAEAPARDPALGELLSELRQRWIGAAPTETTWADAPGRAEPGGSDDDDQESGEVGERGAAGGTAPLVVRPLQLYVTEVEHQRLFHILSEAAERLGTETVSETVLVLIDEAEAAL